MDLELKGKRALVTGASSGLGAAIALELAREGAHVVVHGRDRERVQATAEAAAALGVEVFVATGDLMHDGAAEAISQAATQRFGGIDILVNNAGAVLNMRDASDWLQVSGSAWVDSYNLNVIAAVRMSQQLAPGMAQRGWGRIINISSISGTQMRGRLFDYGASKAALNSFTVNLSKVLAPQGVTVNCIVPGSIMTPAVQRWIETLRREREWPEDLEECERRFVSERAAQPVPRLGRPREIAAAAALLASPLSGYTTGAFLRIDGGIATAVGA